MTLRVRPVIVSKRKWIYFYFYSWTRYINANFRRDIFVCQIFVSFRSVVYILQRTGNENRLALKPGWYKFGQGTFLEGLACLCVSVVEKLSCTERPTVFVYLIFVWSDSSAYLVFFLSFVTSEDEFRHHNPKWVLVPYNCYLNDWYGSYVTTGLAWNVRSDRYSIWWSRPTQRIWMGRK